MARTLSRLFPLVALLFGSVAVADALDAADFVMVTSHPHESPRAVMSFAKRAARHPEFMLEGVVVIHLAAQNLIGHGLPPRPPAAGGPDGHR